MNDEFGHPGVTAAHDGGHLSVELPLKRLWSARVADTDTDIVTLAQPVAVKGKVFALGGDALLSVFDLETGEVLAELQVDDAEDGLYPGVAGGWLPISQLWLFTLAAKMLTLINASTYEVIWTVEHDQPSVWRSDPDYR